MGRLRRCAFLTRESHPDPDEDDALLIAPLAERGWSVEGVPWNRDFDFSGVDHVILRSTWDYPSRPDEFVSALERIASRVPLSNPLELVRRNLRKSYLLELAGEGLPVVPTLVVHSPGPDQVEEACARFDVDSVVVKPAVGADSVGVARLGRVGESAVMEAWQGQECLIQPFMASVLEEGECSLMFFEGEFSHAVRKRPAAGEFRVQERLGGRHESCISPEGARETARSILATLPSVPLYARVDVVRRSGPDSSWMLMELELIEPTLYLRHDEGAAERFAAAFERRTRGGS